MFNPTEIIFACTTSCNLHCAHCFINREPFSLKAGEAVAFLKSAYESENLQIEKVGFSGGEPFLCVDFLCTVIKEAVNMDFMFDRIMTNGDWWKNEDSLRSTLQKIYDAGYDGKIGLSYDDFHGQSEERIVTFIKAVWDIFGGDALEIQSVISLKGKTKIVREASLSPAPRKIICLVNALKLSCEENISESGAGLVSLSDDGHFLPVYIQNESYESSDERAFKDSEWFMDDFCEGPGQILFVHATGDIAPCCGFANENKGLFIGKISDSFDEVLEKSKKSKMIKICYEEGLSNQIEVLKKEGKLPKGKTGDICTFCDFVCKCETLNK